jgi:ubiquitin carboxyl-terminal hydrolase 8
MDNYEFGGDWEIFEDKGLSSLENLGNSCFFNSVLCSLSNCLGLSHFFLKNTYIKVIGPGNREKKEYDFLMFYIQTLVGIFEKNQIISPRTLYKKTCSLSGFEINTQQDAHECLLSILNIIHIATSNKLEEYHIGPIDTKVHEKLLNSNKAWLSDFKQDYSIVNHLFFGQYIQKLRCSDCGYTSFKYESFIDLGLSLQNGFVTIYDLLDGHFKKQTVEFLCEGKCKTQTFFTKRTKIIKLPKYLIVNLKRFTNKMKKIKNTVAFSSTLEMSKYSVAVENKSVEYNIISVINHEGDFNSGHYYTYNRTYNGTWVVIDDKSVKKIDPKQVCTDKAYILIYELSVL